MLCVCSLSIGILTKTCAGVLTIISRISASKRVAVLASEFAAVAAIKLALRVVVDRITQPISNVDRDSLAALVRESLPWRLWGRCAWECYWWRCLIGQRWCCGWCCGLPGTACKETEDAEHASDSFTTANTWTDTCIVATFEPRAMQYCDMFALTQRPIRRALRSWYLVVSLAKSWFCTIL